MSELIPCPFCGGKGHISRRWDNDGDHTWAFVRCRDCGAETRGLWFTDKNDCPIFYQQARDEWNQRKEAGDLRTRLAAAEAVVQAVKDLRTSDQLGPVEPPNNTHFYILTVKSHEKLLEMIAAFDALQKKEDK